MMNHNGLEKCTRKAKVSINAVAMEARKTPDVVMVVVFGSQARGTATPHSDLDVLYVKRNRRAKLYDLFEKAIRRPQGIDRYTLFDHTAHSIKKKMNVYGTMEYWAMREGVIVYQSRQAGPILKRLANYDHDSLSACTREWFRTAEKYYADGVSYEEKYRRDDDFTCHMMYLSVTSLIKSVLVHNEIRFPFSRTLKPLYDLLPDKSTITNTCSLDLISSWQEGPVHKSHHEAMQAARLAQKIYSDTEKSLRNVGRTVGY